MLPRYPANGRPQPPWRRASRGPPSSCRAMTSASRVRRAVYRARRDFGVTGAFAEPTHTRSAIRTGTSAEGPPGQRERAGPASSATESGGAPCVDDGGAFRSSPVAAEGGLRVSPSLLARMMLAIAACCATLAVGPGSADAATTLTTRISPSGAPAPSARSSSRSTESTSRDSRRRTSARRHRSTPMTRRRGGRTTGREARQARVNGLTVLPPSCRRGT